MTTTIAGQINDPNYIYGEPLMQSRNGGGGTPIICHECRAGHK